MDAPTSILDEITYKAKLLVIDKEYLGYTTLVFENLEPYNSDYKYIMCVKFPNWQTVLPEIGTIGFLKVKYIQAGINQWFDGSQMNYYKYTNVQFLNFVSEISKDTSCLVVD